MRGQILWTCQRDGETVYNLLLQQRRTFHRSTGQYKPVSLYRRWHSPFIEIINWENISCVCLLSYYLNQNIVIKISKKIWNSEHHQTLSTIQTMCFVRYKICISQTIYLLYWVRNELWAIKNTNNQPVSTLKEVDLGKMISIWKYELKMTAGHCMWSLT